MQWDTYYSVNWTEQKQHIKDERRETEQLKEILQDMANYSNRVGVLLRPTSNIYKVRAECAPDVVVGFKALFAKYEIGDKPATKIIDIVLAGPYHLNWYIRFASDLTIDEIKAIWKECEDLHVMVESAGVYTDIRFMPAYPGDIRMIPGGYYDTYGEDYGEDDAPRKRGRK